VAFNAHQGAKPSTAFLTNGNEVRGFLTAGHDATVTNFTTPVMLHSYYSGPLARASAS